MVHVNRSIFSCALICLLSHPAPFHPILIKKNSKGAAAVPVQCVRRMELECLWCDSKLLAGGRAKVGRRPAGGGIFGQLVFDVRELLLAISRLLLHIF